MRILIEASGLLTFLETHEAVLTLTLRLDRRLTLLIVQVSPTLELIEEIAPDEVSMLGRKLLLRLVEDRSLRFFLIIRTVPHKLGKLRPRHLLMLLLAQLLRLTGCDRLILCRQVLLESDQPLL